MPTRRATSDFGDVSRVAGFGRWILLALTGSTRHAADDAEADPGKGNISILHKRMRLSVSSPVHALCCSMLRIRGAGIASWRAAVGCRIEPSEWHYTSDCL